MDSKKLEILVAVVDMGSFSRASEVVGYTQSGLTHLMDALEREVGFPLLLRNHSGVRLTEQGELLMPAIREFLQADAALNNRIRDISAQRRDVVRVAAYSSIAIHWMPEILYRFRRICPQVDVDLRMVDHALEPFELLEKGETDLILASRQNYSCCSWTPLYDDWMYAILPEGHQAGDTFPLEAFHGQEFLMPYGNFDKDIRAVLNPMHIVPKYKTAKVDDETVIRMVSRGLGISMMSELMLRGRTQGVRCLPVTPSVKRELGMGTHARKKDSEAIAMLKDCIRNFLSEVFARG